MGKKTQKIKDFIERGKMSGTNRHIQFLRLKQKLEDGKKLNPEEMKFFRSNYNRLELKSDAHFKKINSQGFEKYNQPRLRNLSRFIPVGRTENASRIEANRRVYMEAEKEATEAGKKGQELSRPIQQIIQADSALKLAEKTMKNPDVSPKVREAAKQAVADLSVMETNNAFTTENLTKYRLKFLKVLEEEA